MVTIHLSRRDCLTRAVTASLLAVTSAGTLRGRPLAGRPARSDKLVQNERGGYSFLPGVEFFSWGAVAHTGFEVVRAVFRRPRPFADGFRDVAAHLKAAGRPVHALCGVELRQGRQSTFPEFHAFNGRYVERMREAGLLVGDRMPIARTKVAVAGGPAEPAIHAFCYTVTAPRGTAGATPTFVLTGVPDVRNLGPKAEVVAKDDTTPAGLRKKTTFVLESLEAVLTALGAQWGDATGVQLYTVQDLHSLLAELLLPKLGEAARDGIQWHHAQLPVPGGEVEMDARSTRTEVRVD